MTISYSTVVSSPGCTVTWPTSGRKRQGRSCALESSSMVTGTPSISTVLVATLAKVSDSEKVAPQGIPSNPFGSLCMGTARAAAIGNAIFDATGVRVREVPFTPERLLRQLRTN